MDKKELKKIRKEEDKKFYKQFNKLEPCRIIQLSIVQLLVQYKNNLKINKENSDNFNIKDIKNLVKRIDKIYKKMSETYGDIAYYFNDSAYQKHIIDKFDNNLIRIQKEKQIEIDADEDMIINEIFPYWHLGVHSFYYLELIKENIANVDTECKNLLKGFLMSAKKFNNYLIKELKSDVVFKKELAS